MDIAAVVGVLTIIVGIFVKLVGFPDQVMKIQKRRSVEGISSTFFLAAFVSYVLWTVHGVLQDDWVVIIGQGMGVITSGVIVAQIVLFRSKPDRSADLEERQ